MPGTSWIKWAGPLIPNMLITDLVNIIMCQQDHQQDTTGLLVDWVKCVLIYSASQCHLSLPKSLTKTSSSLTFTLNMHEINISLANLVITNISRAKEDKRNAVFFHLKVLIKENLLSKCSSKEKSILMECTHNLAFTQLYCKVAKRYGRIEQMVQESQNNEDNGMIKAAPLFKVSHVCKIYL